MTTSDPRFVIATGADRQHDATLLFPDPDEESPRMTAMLSVPLGDDRPTATLALTLTDEGLTIDVFGDDPLDRHLWTPNAACWVADSDLSAT